MTVHSILQSLPRYCFKGLTWVFFPFQTNGILLFILISIPVVQVAFHGRASYKNQAKSPNGKAKQNILKKNIFLQGVTLVPLFNIWPQHCQPTPVEKRQLRLWGPMLKIHTSRFSDVKGTLTYSSCWPLFGHFYAGCLPL